MSRDPRLGEALSARLSQPLPETRLTLIGGQVHLPASQVARWFLLYGIAVNGHGHVPPTFLTAPWMTVPNRAEKYFEPILAAAWAVSQTAQRDALTLAALDTVLHQNATPLWVRGDILAALHTLDARPFTYDTQR